MKDAKTDIGVNGGAGGGKGGDLQESLSPLIKQGALALGVFTGIAATLGVMQKHIEETRNLLADANPALQRLEDVQKKILNLALLPISNLMIGLMKPFLKLQIFALKKQLSSPEFKQLQEKIKTGELSGVEAGEAILEQFQPILEQMAFLDRIFKQTTQPVVASLAGFQAGIELNNKLWLSGVNDWVTSFLSSFSSSKELIPALSGLVTSAIDSGELTKSEIGGKDSTLGKLYNATTSELALASKDFKTNTDIALTGLSDVVVDLTLPFETSLSLALKGLVNAVKKSFGGAGGGEFRDPLSGPISPAGRVTPIVVNVNNNSNEGVGPTIGRELAAELERRTRP